MTSTPQHFPDTPARSEQELVGEITRWILSVLRTEPGWESVMVDFKPQGDRVYLRVVEHRNGEIIPGAAGPIKQDSSVLSSLEQLQRRCYLKGRGSWFSVTVAIAARNWPEPEYRPAARYNFQDVPSQFAHEGHYTAEHVGEHLSAFPRVRQYVPEWALGMAEEAGVALQFLEPDQDESARAQDLHPRLRAAAQQYVAAPGDRAMANVLREAMSGMVLLDVTGSHVVPGPDGAPVGPESEIRVQTLTQGDGARALALYTHADQARAVFRANHGDGDQGEPLLFQQRALDVLSMVATDPQYDELVIDPAGEHSMRVPREQIEWVVRAPRNQAVKDALLENNMSGVLAAMLNGQAQLLLGTREVDGQSLPVMVQPEDPEAGPDTIMVFTSAAEIAALEPELRVRAAPSREVLSFALDSGAAAVCVNALAPTATVPAQQLRELLRMVEEQQSS